MELNFNKNIISILVFIMSINNINGQEFSIKKLEIYNYKWDGSTLMPPDDWEFGPYMAFTINITNDNCKDIDLSLLKIIVKISQDCEIVLNKKQINIDGKGKSTPFLEDHTILGAYKSKNIYFGFDFRDMYCNPLNIEGGSEVKSFDYKENLISILKKLKIKMKLLENETNIDVKKENILFKET